MYSFFSCRQEGNKASHITSTNCYWLLTRDVYSKRHGQKDIRRWMMKSTMHPSHLASLHISTLAALYPCLAINLLKCEDNTDTLCTLIMYWKLLNSIRPWTPDVKVFITLAETDSSFTITVLLLHAMWASPQKHNKHKLLPHVYASFLRVPWLVFFPTAVAPLNTVSADTQSGCKHEAENMLDTSKCVACVLGISMFF